MAGDDVTSRVASMRRACLHLNHNCYNVWSVIWIFRIRISINLP
jgi:hypothetical protein